MTKAEQKKILERKKKLLERKAEIEQKLLIDSAKNNYADYVRLTHSYDPEFNIAPFQVYICDTIDKLLKNELLNDKGEPYKGIVWSQPPQTGKSRCGTETLPSYFLGRNPHRHVIEVSYSDSFANRFGRRNLEKIEQYGKMLFGVEVSDKKNAAEEFEIKVSKGGMISAGLNGQITGNPADLVLVDDPYKSMSEADSPSHQKTIMDIWTTAIKYRVSARCKYIVVHTRWNEDDLIGYLLATEPGKWYEINFPMIAEKDEPESGRKVGDPLLPEAGKDKKWVEEEKESFLADPTGGGLRAWNASYQQRPTNIEGNMIKRSYWKKIDLSLDLIKQFQEIILSWDCSFKDTDGSDFVAGTAWGRIGAKYFLIDLDYERKDIVKTMDDIKNMGKRWPKAIAKYIEDKANGPAVIQMMRATVPGLIPVKAIKSKAERVNTVLPLFRAGNVHIPARIETSPGVWEPCAWGNTVIEQCAAFRPEKKVQADDIVDSCSQALRELMYAYVPGERTEIDIGYASENELKDMGIKTMEIRKPQKTIVSW